ncbi:MAG TPA: hypothetical protein VHX18_09275 [Rhizomicrobium sp.]|jgi:hypothetical protein|nr:hypothetical protein [Rhizomicrobium sp.]
MAVVWGLSPGAALAAEPPGGADHAAAAEAQAKAAADLAALCARVTCRKIPRQMSLRMRDNSSFQIGTRMLPYFDDKGTLIIFPGETITLSYAGDDAKLEHPALSSVIDPAGPVALPPFSGTTVSFKLEQMDGKPDMMLSVANTTGAIVKFDTVMFVPDPASGNARGSRTTACPVLPPQGRAPSFSDLENWPQPIVMLLIGNIRALDAAARRACD